jgi:glycosyltransferase involved in cell wall biosynthesis
MSWPLVTIVTPSFNQGRFIRATIESVLGQDYPKIEYFVMDGGSTDETAAVVRDYASRVTFISEKDRGQSHAINKGFRRASGPILAWLNSDDLFLPGAVSRAVRTFREKPVTGAVYGEGYLIDLDGKITCRFPHTQPLNLWKLVYLSDYILQQSVFFRGDAMRELGFLDESLHYTMDWDILIRMAARWPLEYVPEYMGCLREYPDAKSSAGGTGRVKEIAALLRRHTGMRLPPGAVVYGLETYRKIWCERIANQTPGFLSPVSRRLQGGVAVAAGLVIEWTIRHSQGLYDDGWAAPELRYMLPPGRGQLCVEGTVPDHIRRLRGQALTIMCNGRTLGRFPLPAGKFSLQMEVPEEWQGKTLNLKLRARRRMVPARFRLRGDRRRLAWLVEGIRWSELRGADSAEQAPRSSQPAVGDGKAEQVGTT